MDEERRRPRLVWLFVALAVLAVPISVTVWVQRSSFGCCGPKVAFGELWYCREPDALHPVGDVYLLTTHQLDRQAGWQAREWPDRIETGHVGKPLRWMQPAGSVQLALNLDPAGPNDHAVDERQPASVVEGQLTSVLVGTSDDTPNACPAAPTTMSNPAS